MKKWPGLRKITKLFLLILAAALLGICGCGGGGGDGGEGGSTTGNITLKGSVGSGYRTAAYKGETFWAKLRSAFVATTYAQAGKKVDKLIAIPSDRGILNENSMLYSKSAEINADGSFSISLEMTNDWLLVLMDSTAAAKTDQFVGYIAFNTGTADSLLQLPTTTSKISSMDLGTVTASGDTGLSQNTINAVDFSLSSAQLLDLAKNDDAFKSVKNFLINYDNASGVYYTLRPDFRWRGSYASIDRLFQDPAQYTYHHYGFQLDSNTTSITMDKICGINGQTQVVVKTAPPSDVTTTTGTTYNDSNPISSANVTCTTATDGHIEAKDEDFYADNRRGKVSQSCIAELSGPLPSGYWKYYEGTQLKGQFDVAVASPLASDNKIKGFIPSIRVNKDGTGKITSVDMKWYSWDGTRYVALTDVSILKYLIGVGDVYFDNSTNNTRTYESVNFDPAIQTTITPSTYTWYYGTAGPANQQAQSIGIFYYSGGIGYFFEFFR